jgi:hypothetical protein
MLRQEFASSVLWFEDFDERDLSLLSNREVKWLRITRCLLTELPQLQYQTGAHIYVQNTRKLKSVSLEGVASVELEDCFALTSHSIKSVDNVVQLKLRNLTKVESLSFLASASVKALWIEQRPKVLNNVSDALSLSGLQLLWVSPFDDELMENLSQKRPEIWMCNAKHAFHAGVASTDLTPFYDSARAAGFYELNKRPVE